MTSGVVPVYYLLAMLRYKGLYQVIPSIPHPVVGTAVPVPVPTVRLNALGEVGVMIVDMIETCNILFILFVLVIYLRKKVIFFHFSNLISFFEKSLENFSLSNSLQRYNIFSQMQIFKKKILKILINIFNCIPHSYEFLKS